MNFNPVQRETRAWGGEYEGRPLGWYEGSQYNEEGRVRGVGKVGGKTLKGALSIPRWEQRERRKRS